MLFTEKVYFGEKIAESLLAVAQSTIARQRQRIVQSSVYSVRVRRIERQYLANALEKLVGSDVRVTHEQSDERALRLCLARFQQMRIG